jgi:hypothetical protein
MVRIFIHFSIIYTTFQRFSHTALGIALSAGIVVLPQVAVLLLMPDTHREITPGEALPSLKGIPLPATQAKSPRPAGSGSFASCAHKK